MNTLLQRPTFLKLNILQWVMCFAMLITQGCGTCAKNPSDTTSGNEPSQHALDLSYSLKSPEQLKDAQREIQIELINQGKEATLPAKAKLICTRQEGKLAQLKHENQKLQEQSLGKYVIDLPIMSPGTPLNYALTLDPQADISVRWNIELQYDSQPIGKPIQVTWETTTSVVLKDFKWDKKTGRVTCKVLNRGDKAVTKIQIKPTTKNGPVVLPADPIEVDVLSPHSREKVHLVDDAKLPVNGSITVEFAISYEQDGTTINLPAISQTFTREPMQVALEVSELDEYRNVTVNIHPEDKQDDTSKLYLQYENISQEEDSQKATLNGNMKGKTGFKHKDQESFNFDYLNAEEATFRFELLEQYEENGEEKYFPLKSIEKTFKKVVDFSIEVLYLIPEELISRPQHENKSNTYLTHGTQPVGIKIKQHSEHGHEINDQLLKLLIKQEASVQVSTTPGANAIQELTSQGLKWDNRWGESDYLELFIMPATDNVQEAKIALQVQYKGKDIGSPAIIHWKQDIYSIEGNTSLIGDTEGKVEIYCPSRVNDWSPYTISVTSQTQGIVPQFTKSNNSTSSVKEVLSFWSDTINYSVPNPPNDIQQAIINIVLTKGGIELAKKQVNWVKEGISLEVRTDHDTLTHDQPIVISVKNTGINDLDLNNIQVVLTNTAGLDLTLGNRSGNEIKATLAEITQSVQLDTFDRINLQLKLTDKNIASQDVSSIKIDFLDKSKNVVLKTLHLVYIADLTKKEEELDKMDEKQDIKCLIGLQKLVQAYQKQIEQCRAIKNQVPELENLEADIYYRSKRVHQKIDNIQQKLNRLKERIQKDMVQTETITKPENLRARDQNNLIDKLVDMSLWGNGSIKLSYVEYKESLELIKSLLTDNDITSMKPAEGDLPVVQELKKLYEEIENKRSKLPSLVQETLAGFAQQVEEEAKKAIKEKDIKDLEKAINKQWELIDKLTKSYQDFLKVQVDTKEEDWISKAWLEQLLTTNFQHLIENIVMLLDLEKDEHKLNLAALFIQAPQEEGTLGNLLTNVLSQISSSGTQKSVRKAMIETAIRALEKLQSQKGAAVEIDVNGNEIKVQDQIIQLRQQLGGLK